MKKQKKIEVEVGLLGEVVHALVTARGQDLAVTASNGTVVTFSAHAGSTVEVPTSYEPQPCCEMLQFTVGRGAYVDDRSAEGAEPEAQAWLREVQRNGHAAILEVLPVALEALVTAQRVEVPVRLPRCCRKSYRKCYRTAGRKRTKRTFTSAVRLDRKRKK